MSFPYTIWTWVSSHAISPTNGLGTKLPTTWPDVLSIGHAKNFFFHHKTCYNKNDVIVCSLATYSLSDCPLCQKQYCLRIATPHIMSWHLSCCCLLVVRITAFPQFLPTGTINLSACKNSIQFKGGNKTRAGSISLSMQSGVLVHVLSADLMVLRCMHALFYVQYSAVLFASNEHSCLSQDLCYGSALDRPPCHRSQRKYHKCWKSWWSLLWQRISELSLPIGGREACQEPSYCQLLVRVRSLRSIRGRVNFA